MGTPVIISYKTKKSTQHDDQMFRLTLHNLPIYLIKELRIRGLIIDSISRPLHTVIDP